MKIVLKVFLGIVAIIVIATSMQSKSKQEYIRIHIVANSNASIDRSVKLDIKDKVNAMLVRDLAEADDKSLGMQIISARLDEITNSCNTLLKENNLNYTACVSLKKEYFPSRKYSNTMVESGYYDSLNIVLGSGSGDNWWCVMYPPICYKGKETKLSFSSRIKEWFGKNFC